MKASGIILMGLAFLLAISSCATIPQPPLSPGEVRLLKMDIPQNGNVSANVEYLITIYFESEGNIEIIESNISNAIGKHYEKPINTD